MAERETLRQAIEDILAAARQNAPKRYPSDLLIAHLTAALAKPDAREGLDESEPWFHNLNVGVRELVTRQSDRSSRHHLIASIDEAVRRLRATPADAGEGQAIADLVEGRNKWMKRATAAEAELAALKAKAKPADVPDALSAEELRVFAEHADVMAKDSRKRVVPDNGYEVNKAFEENAEWWEKASAKCRALAERSER